MQTCQSAGKIFAVGGGKGGVGKSIFAISLAFRLVYNGYKVIIADLDLGAAKSYCQVLCMGLGGDPLLPINKLDSFDQSSQHLYSINLLPAFLCTAA